MHFPNVLSDMGQITQPSVSPKLHLMSSFTAWWPDLLSQSWHRPHIQVTRPRRLILQSAQLRGLQMHTS